MAGFDLSRLTRSEKIEFIAIHDEKQRRLGQRGFFALYPDTDQVWLGPEVAGDALAPGRTIYARSRYAKHLEFFEAGAKWRERCAMCANRIGKTFGMGGYETACHLTGLYPEWWIGRRFTRPVRWWAAGKTNETTRDIVQTTLLGEVIPGVRKGVSGTGIIPGDTIDLAASHGSRASPTSSTPSASSTLAVDTACWGSRAISRDAERSRGPRNTASGSTRSPTSTSTASA
jgi:hypothetical protein